MSESKTTASGGIGFTGVLTIVFVVLKLLGKIDWSWVWVLSPLWIPIVSIVSMIIVIGIIVIGIVLIKKFIIG